jgi:hypothetical protein
MATDRCPKATAGSPRSQPHAVIGPYVDRPAAFCIDRAGIMDFESPENRSIFSLAFIFLSGSLL